ncbi:MAG: TRAP transporter large permease [Pseudomonadota bacterium]
MNPTTIGLIGIVVLVLLFFSRLPVAYCMALVGTVGFSIVVTPEAGLRILATDIFETFSSYGLTVIPLFILMGQLAFNAGISRKLYDTAFKMIGHMRGGLALATIMACTAFGAVCGSSAAVAATMATVGLPEMKRYGYGDAIAAGSVASGGTLGMLMPPSVVMIVYGILTEQSIGALFIAGIIPAVFIALLFMIAIYIYCLFRPAEGPRGARVGWKEKILSLGEMGETLFVFLLVMGGLFLGWFTPTEAGGIGAFGIFVLSLFRRSLTWQGFVKSLYETMRTSCMTMMLVAGAVIFGHFLAITRIPFEIAGWVAGLSLPPLAVIGVIVLVYLIGGCFIDALALIMLTIPMFYPIILHLGYDPIWFGVIIVLVTQMGVITPPVGLNVYVVGGIAQDVSLEKIFLGALPFLAALVVGTGVIMALPELATWLPKLMYGM